MVSTNGKSPKLANILRKRIEESIPKGAGDAIEKVGVLREKLKERAPGVGGDVRKRRMKWMVDLCTSWELDDLAGLDVNVALVALEEKEMTISRAVAPLRPSTHTSTSRGSTPNCLFVT